MFKALAHTHDLMCIDVFISSFRILTDDNEVFMLQRQTATIVKCLYRNLHESISSI